jgi:hypothetical protein
MYMLVVCGSAPTDAQTLPPGDPAPDDQAASPSAPLQRLYETLARETQQAFEAGSFDAMQGRFSAAFLSQVPLATLNTIPASYAAQFGLITGVVFKEQRDDPQFAPGTLFFTALLDDDRQAVLRMKLDADLQIVAWHLGPAFEPKMSLDDLRTRLRALDGRVSVFARQVGQSTPFFSLYPDNVLAIGSAFKLYVLAELLRQSEDEGKALDTIVRLRGWGQSLPSGRLQDWPFDTPMTLQSLATLMISESDNTATDHLIDAIGRETLENQLGREYGNSLPQRNVPFLKTRELFMLQARGAPWDSLRQRYLAGTISEKRDVLAELRDLTIQGMPAVQPIGRTFTQFEWYATTRNLVDVLGMLCGDSLLRKPLTRDISRGILSINPGIPASGDGRIAFLAYKGGSEDGVLNMTQYVETRSGEAFALSMTWNRDEGPTDLNTLVPLFQSLRSLMLDSIAGEAE